jgi:MATE family multidrug resistance protein
MAGEIGRSLRRSRRVGSRPTAAQPVSIREVATLSWPIAVQMLSYTAMGLVDTLFVGQVGTAALAAVGLGSITAHFVQGGGVGLVSGTRVLVSQRHGAGDAEGARVAAWSGLRVAAVLSLLAPLSVFALGPALALLGAEGSVHAIAVDWTRIRVAAVPFLLMSVALSAWFQGRGDTRTPMVSTLVANGVNIALDPIFVWGLGPIAGIGAVGTAAATVGGMATGLLVLGVAARWSLGAAPGLERDSLARVFTLGMPMGARYLLEVGAFAVFAALLSSVGDAAMAAHIVVIRIASVSFLPGHAIGEAASVLVGQAVGAGAPRRARSAWWSATVLATTVMGVFGGLFLAAPDLLTAGFGVEPEVAAIARGLLQVGAVFQMFDAVAMVGLGALAGAGETRFTMRLGVLAAWLVKLPLGYAFVMWAGLGAAGAWWGLTAEIAVVAVIVVVRIRRAAWARVEH